MYTTVKVSKYFCYLSQK